MRIGIVTRRVGPNDGQGRVNMEVAREALRQGCGVTLFCESADPVLQDCGAQVVALPPAAFLPSRLLRDQVFAARSAFALRGCDAVLANGFATWARSDVNAVHFVHRAWAASPHHPWRQHHTLRSLYARLYAGVNASLERGAFRRASQVVAVSEKLKAELVAGGVPPARITTILNGVDTQEFAPGPADRAALGLPAQVPIALFAGDLRTSRKNLDSVLQALATSAPALHLAVAGRHDNTGWPAMADRLGLSDRVHFLGFRTDMPAVMRAADFFVFPSRYEACSLVLLEALASGLPVITAISAAMARLAQDASLLAGMRHAARRTALAHGWQAMARRYLALLEAAHHA
jgi:glycosyltransferase involved in cell wall biosynthesis